jgi:hypothetical protein
MSNHLQSKLWPSFLTLLIVSSSFAQQVETLPPVTVSSSTALSSIGTKISKSFNADFKNAVGAKWYKLNKNYLVYFISGDMENRALYKKNGFRIYNISYGNEKNLPKKVRDIVKSRYFDYQITNVLNVKQDDRNVWIVNMQDDKKLIIARVEDGVMDEVHSYDKSFKD